MRTPRHRLASLGNPKEKCSLLFGFARDQFLLKRKGHFSLVFCPPSIRAGGGATILSARAWRNSPHTPLPPCPRFQRRIFWRRHKNYSKDRCSKSTPSNADVEPAGGAGIIFSSPCPKPNLYVKFPSL